MISIQEFKTHIFWKFQEHKPNATIDEQKAFISGMDAVLNGAQTDNDGKIIIFTGEKVMSQQAACKRDHDILTAKLKSGGGYGGDLKRWTNPETHEVIIIL